MLDYIIRDEARHVTFGVNYLEEFVTNIRVKKNVMTEHNLS